jgi:hypothetical protein
LHALGVDVDRQPVQQADGCAHEAGALCVAAGAGDERGVELDEVEPVLEQMVDRRQVLARMFEPEAHAAGAHEARQLAQRGKAPDGRRLVDLER